MAELQIKRRDAKLAAGLNGLDTNLRRCREGRLGGYTNDEILADDVVILKPQLFDDRNRVLLKSVVDYRPTRRYSSNTAFSRRAWLSRTDHLELTPLLGTAVRFGMEEESFYYHIDTPPQGFEHLVKFLNEHPVIVVEIDGIVRGPEGHERDEYAKGIIIHRIADRLVHISELAVRHPGTVVFGARALAPWTYRITESGAFVRQSHEHDCPCNNHGRHEHLFRYAQIFELLLGEGTFEQVAALEYLHKDLGS